MVECKEKQKHSHEHITQKGDNSTAYSFWNRVDCLHKELKEYWYAAVEEYAQQNAGCVQCSYDRNKNSYSFHAGVFPSYSELPGILIFE